MQGKYLIIFLALYFCSFLFQDIFLEPTNVPRFAIVSIFLLFTVLFFIYNTIPIVIPKLPLFIALVGFYLLNLASSAWAVNIADSFYESQKIFLQIIIIIACLSFINSVEEELLLIQSLIISAYVYVVYTAIQIAGLSDLNNDSLYNITSFSEHKNLLSSYLFLLLPFAVYGALLLTHFWKVVSKFIFFLIILILLFLQTRAVYIALFCSLFILSFLFFKKRPSNFKILLIGIFSLFIIVVVFSSISDSFSARVNIFNYQSSESSKERLSIWRNTILLIKEYPFFGVGAGNWQYLFSKYSISHIDNIVKSSISFQRPHNDFLWILSESGIIGFSLIVFILLYILIKIRISLKSGLDDHRSIKTKIFFSFLCGLLVISFFSFEKERISHIIIASILIALLIKNLGITSVLNKKKQIFIVMIGLIGIVFNLTISLYRLKGEYYTNLLFKNLNQGKPETVIDYGTKALSPFYLTDPTSTPVYSYIASAYNEMNRFHETLEYSKNAFEISPYDYKVLSNYGYILERFHYRKEAEIILSEALRINPFYEQAIINMVVLKYNQERYTEALELVNQLNKGKMEIKFYEEKIKSKLQASRYQH